MRRLVSCFALVLLSAACSKPGVSTSVQDGGTEPSDAAVDAPDAAVADDAGVDAGVDAGPQALCGMLQNTGAETGDLTGWTSEYGAFAASTGLPSPAPAGSYVFYSGLESSARISQFTDLSSQAALIDEGKLFAHLAAQVRVDAYAAGAQAYLEIEALDKAHLKTVTARSVPLVNGYWDLRRVSLALPVGTRALNVALHAEGAIGSAMASFDEVQLCLDSTPPFAEESLVAGPSLTWPTVDAMTISWELPSSGPTMSVAYGTTPALGSTVAATQVDTRHRRARLTGLTVDTDYWYRLEGLDYPGELHKFHTNPVPGPQSKPYSFVIWGDNQDGVETFRGLAQQMAALQPAFMISVGDQVQAGLEALYHSQLLQPLYPMEASVPHIGAPGNHNALSDATLAQWGLHVPQPDAHCFGWRYANIHFISLDTNASLAVTALPGGCLDRILSNDEFKTAEIKVAIFHEPPRTDYWAGGTFTGNDAVRLYIEPKLKSAGVQAVFTGHVHMYFWGPPSATGGVTWTTTGGGGGSLESTADRDANWTELQNATFIFRHHFLHATVDGKVLTVRAIADTGEELHRFTVGTP